MYIMKSLSFEQMEGVKGNGYVLDAFCGFTVGLPAGIWGTAIGMAIGGPVGSAVGFLLGQAGGSAAGAYFCKNIGE